MFATRRKTKRRRHHIHPGAGILNSATSTVHILNCGVVAFKSYFRRMGITITDSDCAAMWKDTAMTDAHTDELPALSEPDAIREGARRTVLECMEARAKTRELLTRSRALLREIDRILSTP
jgi:hypothetical protein